MKKTNSTAISLTITFTLWSAFLIFTMTGHTLIGLLFAAALIGWMSN